MKVSFIATVFNEAETISDLLHSLANQSRLPDEIVFVDGGSTDDTVSIISNFKFPISKKKVKIIVKKGNRSVGRNEAIRKSTGDIIVCTDAGCVLDRDWIKNIIAPFNDPSVDVVAGYYKGRAKTIFQKCLVPYVLVMPDKLSIQNFLPATRSIAFQKEIWRKAGGFDEKYSYNEDYIFAHTLKKIRAKIMFTKDAIAYWIPRNNIKKAFNMFLKFAYGDAEAKIIRTKVLLLFARYVLGLYFIFLSLLYKQIIGFLVLLIALLLYALWSVYKNYRYIKDTRAFFILPIIQFTADAAVLIGTMLGIVLMIRKFNFYLYANKNKFLLFVIFVYCVILVLLLEKGAPNVNHPFPYFMDEWHQLNAVRATFAYGTPNIAGAANGTMFHFFLSGLYIIPFTLLGWINPATIQIDDFINRARLFNLLRMNTMLWGVLSICLVYYIADYIKGSKKLAITLFTFTPIWLTLSGYFKYDIALIFWILLSILFLVRYIKNPNSRNYIIAAIPVGLAVSVKVSAVTLLPIYGIAYLLLRNFIKNIKYLVLGMIIFSFTVLFFGMPDTLFGKGNILDYLYDNIIRTPNYSANYKLEIHPYQYLLFRHYPIVFGYGLLFLFIAGLISQTLYFRNNILQYLWSHRILFFFIICFFAFLISILPLQIFAGGNRSLVLLPFTVLITSLIYKSTYKPLVKVIILIAVVIQLYQSFSWLYTKYTKGPQEIASSWIVSTIKKGETIGIENIPIYQMLPDIVQREYCFLQYGVKFNAMYQYEIIDENMKILPNIVILTNGEIETKLLKESPKKEILTHLEKEGYKKLKVFTPNLTYFRVFGDDVDYYLSGILVAYPVTISIFEK